MAMGGHGVMANEESLDYSVHEAWNEATNVYLLVILVSFGLLMYARNLQKVRLRQQLEMYSFARKFDQQQHQCQSESVQLSME
ncbi:unnamed protein product [Coregonus sp. 'balchen']|nr:unnamed protein product [Coregonus sp. 'balchen']